MGLSLPLLTSTHWTEFVTNDEVHSCTE